jgi:hypothetical protein
VSCCWCSNVQGPPQGTCCQRATWHGLGPQRPSYMQSDFRECSIVASAQLPGLQQGDMSMCKAWLICSCEGPQPPPINLEYTYKKFRDASRHRTGAPQILTWTGLVLQGGWPAAAAAGLARDRARAPLGWHPRYGLNLITGFHNTVLIGGISATGSRWCRPAHQPKGFIARSRTLRKPRKKKHNPRGLFRHTVPDVGRG